jgi:hypothetical protein
MPADLKWNKPFNFFDIMSKAYRDYGARLPAQDARAFYGEMINSILGRIRRESAPTGRDSLGEFIPINRPAATGVVEAMAELIWYEYNRPVWFVDKTMTELLMTAKIDDDLTGIHFPNECVYLCFEQGTQVEGFDLRSIMLFVPRADQTIKMVRQATGNDDIVAQFMSRLIGTWTDCLAGPEYELLQGGTIRSRNRLYNWRKYTEPAPETDSVGVDEQEKKAMRRSMQIAAAAMLYYSARPELVAEYQLPRSQRYEFKGERSGFRRMTLPGIKHIRPQSAATPGMGTGSSKSPHYRGWVMRVLRDPRYKRKADGSFETVLVPPTAIHPELMAENPEA